ncbi:hypothetical protein [uncultured Draconibacterium sp.]|uniref:glycoside hydrolase family 78 protein n=1 Tax=uncultured Draconibacterium sp. TaxID=1573823 RepID=UPI0026012C38|nr:hypothetical protein [uncultured Draconibacterium sp.]
MIKTNILKKQLPLLSLTFYALIILLSACTQNKSAITNLTTEYTTTPLGIDVEQPRFAWQMQAPEGVRDLAQTAYQIEVKSAEGEVVWNSEKVNSNTALAIPYEGEKLQPKTRYEWTVKVWDNNNEEHSATSWFETGLMNPDNSAWDGAQWIGGGDDDLVFYSQYEMIFKMKYAVAIAEGSSKAGFVFGANDMRLMDRYKNIYQLENERNESYIKLELDVSAVDGSSNGLAKLNIYRAGYTKTDNPAVPLKTFSIKSSVINAANKNDKHLFELRSAFGNITITLDQNPDFFVKRKDDSFEDRPWLQNAF